MKIKFGLEFAGRGGDMILNKKYDAFRYFLSPRIFYPIFTAKIMKSGMMTTNYSIEGISKAQNNL